MLVELLPLALVLLALVLLLLRDERCVALHRQIKVPYLHVPLVGHAYKFIGSPEGRMALFAELARLAHRQPRGMVSFWFAHYLCVCVADAAAAAVVFRTCFDKWPLTYFMRHLLGNGSVFGEEEIWRVRRKILNPIFSSKHHDMYVKVFERNSKIMAERLASVAGRGEVSVWTHFSSYAMDSAFDICFGENLGAQSHPRNAFAEAFQAYFEELAARVCQPWLYGGALYALLPAGARQERRKRALWAAVERLIDKKKKEREEHLEHDNMHAEHARFKSMLDLLVEGSGGAAAGYTRTELREEALTIVLGAVDTSATAACFAALLLAAHPRVQDAVYREIEDVLYDSGRAVTVEDLPKLKYLEAVVKETLRLYPPVPLVLRRCGAPVPLPGGAELPAGCEVLLSVWGVQRNPRAWGADADAFRPERFLSATPEQLAAFLPFGHGPRMCTGMRLALASLQLSLAELVRRYRLRAAGGAGGAGAVPPPLRVTFKLMLKHANDFRVHLENRSECC